VFSGKLLFIEDQDGARFLLNALSTMLRRCLNGGGLNVDWCEKTWHIAVEIVLPPAQQAGFVMLVRL
jgi:hypothetical protein